MKPMKPIVIMKPIIVKKDDYIDGMLRKVCNFFRIHKKEEAPYYLDMNFESLSPAKRKVLTRDLQGFMRITDIMYIYGLLEEEALDNCIKVSACIKGNLERVEEE